MAEVPETPSQDSGDVDVDSLLDEINSPAEQRPMSGEEAPAAQPEAPQWNGQEWEFEWNGKKIAPDSRDKAKIWMSQGYNYSQRMGELNKTQAQLKTEYDQKVKAAQELEKKFSPYAEVDDYARKNPQWWQTVQQQYQAAQQQQTGIDPAIHGVIKPLEEKLSKFEQFFGQMEQEKLQAEIKHQDQALDQEIQSIRDSHSNIDLAALDPQTGETLETSILKHAQKIGTQSFKAAFWDYLGPKLIEQAKASGREAIAKDAQANAKKGILGKTQAPLKGVQAAQNVKGKSYNSLAQEALREFGLTT